MKLLLMLPLLALASCVTQKKAMDSWLGSTKQELIMNFGPPARSVPDGNSGEVLIWSQQLYNNFTGNRFYKNTMFYVSSIGLVYHWLIQQGAVPPEQVNVTFYSH